MADQKQLSDGRPAGCVMGQSSSDLIGFYGLATSIAKPSVTQEASTKTSTQLRAELTALQDALAALGLITVA